MSYKAVNYRYVVWQASVVTVLIYKYNRKVKQFWFWRYLTSGVIWHLSQSSIWPSIYFSSIVISRPNPFLEPTNTKELLQETTDAFDRARTHDLHNTNQTCNPLRHAAPCDDLVARSVLYFSKAFKAMLIIMFLQYTH